MLVRRGPDALSAFIASAMEMGQKEVGDKLSVEAPDIRKKSAPLEKKDAN